MIGMIPIIVVGGVTKKFSEGMLGKSKSHKIVKTKRRSKRIAGPLSSKHSPF